MKLELREINRNDKDELLEMVNEIKTNTLEDKFEGFRNISSLTSDNFNDFLLELEHNKNMKLYKSDLVNQTTFILVDENNHIYGGTNIRHELNNNLLLYGGHIGYLIRPKKRKKGFGTIMLNKALLECQKLWIEKVLVTCREENLGSRKVIENNGGRYENSLRNDKENKTYRRYWFNIRSK